MANRKLIIHIEDEIPHAAALAMVSDVMDLGRISSDGTSYSLVTKFAGNKIVFAAVDNPTSDTFYVRKELPAEEL